MRFSTKYPCLAYWIDAWGYIQLGIDAESPVQSLLSIIDTGGTCWEDEGSNSIEEALEAGEKYLRTVEFPDRLSEEEMDALEKSIKKDEKARQKKSKK